MIDRITAHNDLNGVKFATIEFVAIALLVTPFSVYYFAHARWVLAAITLGIVLNCAVVVAYGARAWAHGQAGSGWRALRDRHSRARLSAAYPHMLADTITLVASLLLPFVLLSLVTYELLRPTRRRNG